MTIDASETLSSSAPDDPPFLLPSGTNERVDKQTTTVEDSFGAVSKTVDGKSVIDTVALAAGMKEMAALVERVEQAFDQGIKVKKVDSDGNIVEAASTPMRSNDEIVAMVKKYMTAPGPTFISDPIDGFVYVGRTPRTSDHIDSETEASTQGGDPLNREFSRQFSLVLHCLYGRIAEDKTSEIQLIKTLPSDTGKWGGLLEDRTKTTIAIMTDPNPYATDWVIRPLLTAWWTWWISVRPTPDELKKYRALAGSGTTS
jgi:hypothetical protein